MPGAAALNVYNPELAPLQQNGEMALAWAFNGPLSYRAPDKHL